MKKVFFVIVIAVIPFIVNAQKIKFGAKAGLNVSDIDGYPDDVSKRNSFHIGALVEIPFSRKFSLQPEIVFSNQGMKTSFLVNDLYAYVKTESTFKLSYLNVPILLKYYVFKGFSLEFGPQVSYLLRAKREYEDFFINNNDNTSYYSSGEVDVKDGFKDFDYGLGFGIAYKLDFGLSIGARYNLGLEDIDDVTVSDTWNYKNKVIQVSAGYFF